MLFSVIRLTTLYLFLLGCNHGNTTDADHPIKDSMLSPQDSLGFPESWQGKWIGALEIYGLKGVKQRVEMALEVAPIDSSDNYTWALIYGEDKVKGRRFYELETVDAQKGYYAIDEKNTIKLDCQLINQKLFSRFEVMDNLLLCTYELRGDEIIFEVTSGSKSASNATGNQIHNGDEIPEVKSYSISTSQRAVLKREK